MSRTLPPTASVATPQDGAKLSAPAAERNAESLTNLLALHAPNQGQALEIASGTGQHIVHFARAMQGLEWHPSEPDPARRASIDAYVSEAQLPNLRPSIALDATAKGWGAQHQPKTLIVLINLLHLISTDEAQRVVQEVAAALSPGGMLLFYGPFKRAGQLTSAGDARFDAELRSADPQIGYKDDALISDWLGTAGMADIMTVEMPANNLVFMARRT